MDAKEVEGFGDALVIRPQVFAVLAGGNHVDETVADGRMTDADAGGALAFVDAPHAGEHGLGDDMEQMMGASRLDQEIGEDLGSPDAVGAVQDALPVDIALDPPRLALDVVHLRFELFENGVGGQVGGASLSMVSGGTNWSRAAGQLSG